MTAQNYDCGDMLSLGFSGTSQKLISNYFFMILFVIRTTNVPSSIVTFLQIVKVQSNIYRIVGCNKLYLKSFIRNYSHVKMSNFGGRDLRDRERVGYRNISYIFFSVPWLKVCREGAFFLNFYMALHAIVGWCYQFMYIPMKIRGPCQGPDW